MRNLTIALSIFCFAAACGGDEPREPATSNGDDYTLGDGDDTGDGDGGPQRPDCDGASEFIALAGAADLSTLLEDPHRCALYAVAPGARELYIVDTDADTVQVVDVGAQPTDVALSPDGALLFVAVFGEQKIVALDPTTAAVIDEAATSVPPYRLAHGGGRRVFYVGRDGASAVYEVNFITGLDAAATSRTFHEPDLVASADGTTLYLGESQLAPSRLHRLDATAVGLPDIDTYDFDGGFTLPTPRRGVVLAEEAGRVYFAERLFNATNVKRLRGFLGEAITAVTSDGTLVAGDESLFDGATLVPFAVRPHPGSAALFSLDGEWLYEFDATAAGLYRTPVARLIGVHRLGEHNVPPGGLSQRKFTQLLADPARPFIYALDSQQNQLVYISRETLLPVRAEVIGSSPTDMAMTASGDRMVVATFGATELAVLDLDNSQKVLASVIVVPSNPFRVAVSFSGEAVYAEQDGVGDLRLLDVGNGAILATLPDTGFQVDLEFDPTGRYLFAGESAGPGAVLRRYDLLHDTFTEVGVSSPYDYPGRKIIFHAGSVYFAGRKLDAATLTEQLDFGEDIVLVTPDGRFAVSRSKVFQAATASVVSGLPVESGLLAADPDEPLLYQFDNDTGTLLLHTLPSD